MLLLLLSAAVALVLILGCLVAYVCLIAPRLSPLRRLPSPPVRGWLGSHLGPLTDPSRSPHSHDMLVKGYGRTVRVRGLGPWDDRLFTQDPLAMAHVLKNSTIYEKPWQSRSVISRLIGCGLLSSEGIMHKRQRRVATPAFSVQNLRALVPLVVRKGIQLQKRWAELVRSAQHKGKPGEVIDVAVWVYRATFDVIGLADFDYDFNSINDDSNELFLAYKNMFEAGISQQSGFRPIVDIYVPWLSRLFPDRRARAIAQCQSTIRRVAGEIIKRKKDQMAKEKDTGSRYSGRDLLSLLLKSNNDADMSPQDRLSEDELFDNINTFLFAGSDTTSLAVTWTLILLAQHPTIQSRLREELRGVLSTTSNPKDIPDLETLNNDEIQSLYGSVADLPLLDNVVRESLRLIPPVHSSLRVATCDDVVPTQFPVMERSPDGKLRNSGVHNVKVPRGTFVHIPIESFNLDKEVWGEDAWNFNPERWDSLNERAKAQPGLFSNMLTFSAGPRSCIGMRFSLIEIKAFLYLLVSSFVFAETEEKVFKANVVLTRPYVRGKFKEGSKCPLLVTPYVEDVSPTLV